MPGRSCHHTCPWRNSSYWRRPSSPPYRNHRADIPDWSCRPCASSSTMRHTSREDRLPDRTAAGQGQRAVAEGEQGETGTPPARPARRGGQLPCRQGDVRFGQANEPGHCMEAFQGRRGIRRRSSSDRQAPMAQGSQKKRDRLRQLGWTIIVITADDIRDEVACAEFALSVARELTLRGCDVDFHVIAMTVEELARREKAADRKKSDVNPRSDTSRIIMPCTGRAAPSMLRDSPSAM